MRGIYTQKRSPFYWFRYYDKLEPDKAKRRKAFNTKIEITEADKRRIAEARVNGTAPKYQGTSELRRMLEGFRAGMAERVVTNRTGIEFKKKKLFSEGFAEFVQAHAIPDTEEFHRPKTAANYKTAETYWRHCFGDKAIHKYGEECGAQFLVFLNDYEIPPENRKNKTKKLGVNSKSMYTKALSTIWNFFVKKGYASLNIIKVVASKEEDPDPIPLQDMAVILKCLLDDTDYPHHFNIVYFMLLTGARPSTAVVQLKEHIYFESDVIKMKNVKAGSRKREKKEFFQFPLYCEFKRHLSEVMGIESGDEGRLFPEFAYTERDYTSSLRFWTRLVVRLKKEKQIARKYILKQIRPTTANFLINAFNMSVYDVSKLLDHAGIKVTEKHYIRYNLNKIKDSLSGFNIDTILSHLKAPKP